MLKLFPETAVSKPRAYAMLILLSVLCAGIFLAVMAVK